jgi:hypothetical protein
MKRLKVLRRKEQAKIFLESLHSTSLLVETVFRKHIDEIFSDPAFLEEIILADCQTASPSELRKMAVQDREKGKLKFAYYLEVIADQRERGEFA